MNKSKKNSSLQEEWIITPHYTPCYIDSGKEGTHFGLINLFTDPTLYSGSLYNNMLTRTMTEIGDPLKGHSTFIETQKCELEMRVNTPGNGFVCQPYLISFKGTDTFIDANFDEQGTHLSNFRDHLSHAVTETDKVTIEMLGKPKRVKPHPNLSGWSTANFKMNLTKLFKRFDQLYRSSNTLDNSDWPTVSMGICMATDGGDYSLIGGSYPKIYWSGAWNFIVGHNEKVSSVVGSFRPSG